MLSLNLTPKQPGRAPVSDVTEQFVSIPDELSAQHAAYRLVHICELLEVYEVPAEQIEELRTPGRRFVHQLHALPDFQERLIEWARRYCR